MKTMTWYNEYLAIERNGKKRIYALRQVSWASMRRLWRVNDHCTLESRDFYKSVLRFK